MKTVLPALLFALALARCNPPPPDHAGKPAIEPVATQPANVVPLGESRLVDRPDEIISRLDSGLTVIVKRYAAAPVVSVRMHVKAGSIWEDRYAGAGISHLFEHLLHGGATPGRSQEQSEKLLNEMGASSNAYTSYDSTVYFIDVPSRHANQAINLLADWVTRPTFPQADVNRELGVVQRELERGEQEADDQLWQKMDETRYLVHPARFPVIGQQAALARLTRQDILGYYKLMYVPSNIVVAV
ncbi:MAG: pitrilysin family protein, partial [Phycisphaerae bacterium]|nr:pitrilysin family protein [Phycisphaerae bacterium]